MGTKKTKSEGIDTFDDPSPSPDAHFVAYFDVEVLKAEEDKEGLKGLVEAIVSAYNVPYRMGFRTYHNMLQGAFAAAIKANPVVPLFWQHNWDWSEQPPIGTGEGSEVTAPKAGLKIAGQFFLDTEAGRSVFNAIKAKALVQWSIGYRITKYEVEEDDESGRITLNISEAELLEASSVLRGANPETDTLKVAFQMPPALADALSECAEAIKNQGEVIGELHTVMAGLTSRMDHLEEVHETLMDSFSLAEVIGSTTLPLADREKPWDGAAATKRLAGDGDTIDQTRMTAGHFWRSGDTEKKGSYKLPFADVIDGQVKVIPKGVFAVASVLQGGRGGADIPASAIQSIKAKVEGYYSKMADKFGDPDLKPPWVASSGEGVEPVERGDGEGTQDAATAAPEAPPSPAPEHGPPAPETAADDDPLDLDDLMKKAEEAAAGRWTDWVEQVGVALRTDEPSDIDDIEARERVLRCFNNVETRVGPLWGSARHRVDAEAAARARMAADRAATEAAIDAEEEEAAKADEPAPTIESIEADMRASTTDQDKVDLLWGATERRIEVTALTEGQKV